MTSAVTVSVEMFRCCVARGPCCKIPSLRERLVSTAASTRSVQTQASVVAETPTQQPVEMSQDSIIKPQVDDWAYRHILLDNGIAAVLVSDPEADKAAASMDVRVLSQTSATLIDSFLMRKLVR